MRGDGLHLTTAPAGFAAGVGRHVLRASLVERSAPLEGLVAGRPPPRLRAVAAPGPRGHAPRLRGALVLLAGGLALALGGLLGG